MSATTPVLPPPGLTRRLKVGLVLAFTGHYESVRLLHRFLELAGFEVVTSKQSTTPIIEAGTRLSSADFCFPLRVYVGHVHTLSRLHPDLDAILAPNVWRDQAGSITCCKYRDIGGVTIRSLRGMIPYLDGLRSQGAPPLPRLIRPNIQSVGYTDLRNVAFEIYAELLGLTAWSKAGFFLPAGLQRRWASHVTHVERAFAAAWQAVMTAPAVRLPDRLKDPARPRLALVGRRYLVDDPALSADLKPWFTRRGAAVLTARDVPWSELEPYYRRAEGFYDTHREGHAFIDWAADKVDGFITLGAFGCHPDAFQVDYLAEYARTKGKPTWTLRFDETSGTAGFQTRFETIYGFLEAERDRRVASLPAPRQTLSAWAPGGGPSLGSGRPRPLFVWPYMGEVLNLVLEELLVQLGLQEYACPPEPIDGETLQIGNRRYAETCSPFAAVTGSTIQTIRRGLRNVKDEAASRGETPEPRRVLVLMVQGEGPCTFGWYAIAERRHLPVDLAADLADGHTVELLTAGLKDPVEILRQLACLSGTRHLEPILRYVEAQSDGTWPHLSKPRQLRLQFGIAASLRSVLAPVWTKLAAAEKVRAKALLVRAHELEPGSTTTAYRECLELLEKAHTSRAIRQARNRCLTRLEAVPQDGAPAPRVVAVGEIYAALTSFANRGVVEKLMGQEGLEVVEGITLSGFIHRSLREWQRRRRANHPRLRPLRLWLAERAVEWLAQRPDDLKARPFLEWEVGGEGMPGVAAVRRQIEKGCDGIIHVYPFKCMPEGIAKDAYKELSDLYGVRYLGLSFDKETEIERVKTEVATFTALLRAGQEGRSGGLHRPRMLLERFATGLRLDWLYRRTRRNRRVPL